MVHKKATVAAGEFKAKCLQLIESVSKKHASFVITKRGRPVAKLVPYEEEPASLFGCMRDSVVIYGDIVEGTGEQWEADE